MISRILPNIKSKNNRFSAVVFFFFNFEQTRTVTIFRQHGIMAFVIFLDFHLTVQGLPLVDYWPHVALTKIKCIPIVIHLAMYHDRDTLQHVIKTWWKVV